ncbi:MAG TPA: helix-turn-helix domain-containing protein [Streptosporangiaceae bacterium]
MDENPTITLTGPLEPRDSWTAANCPLDRALQVVGTRSAMLLLREAFYGTTRFADFAARVGISEPVAAARLRELADAGLIERAPYQEPGQRTRLGYQLTQQGAELLPALVALMHWGDKWLGSAGVELRHHDCGEPVTAELHCAAGHHPAAGEVDLVSRPRGPARVGAQPG